MSQKTKITIFISTGEVSGDLQGALLIEALKRQAVEVGLDLEIVALGGSRMAASGATLIQDTTAIGSVGILETLPFILPTLQVQQVAKQYLKQHPPDLLVLIDYMEPNLAIGNYVRRNLPQVPILFYIAPQVWVWSLGDKNTKRIISVTDQILAIFPEEARYFQERGASVSFVGHPLIDRIQAFPNREQAREKLGIESDQVAIALIPASRHQELKYLLPVMFQAAQQIQQQIPNAHFWIPLSLEVYRHKIEQAIEQYGLRATLVANQTPEVLAAVDLAITKSGTVNLELALLDIPQVVIYRVHPFTAWVGYNLLKFSIPFMSPPNLVLMKEIVPELQQTKATPENIVRESLELLLNQNSRQQVLAGYQEMRQLLGEVGVCDRAAQEILKLLTVNTSEM